MLNAALIRLRDVVVGARPDLALQVDAYLATFQPTAWDLLQMDGRVAIDEALRDAYVAQLLQQIEVRWVMRLTRPDAKPDFVQAMTREFENACRDAINSTSFLHKGMLLAKGSRLAGPVAVLKHAHEMALGAVGSAHGPI